MKRLTLIAALLAGVTFIAPAQRRTYLQKDYSGLRQTMYVSDAPSGELEYCIELKNWGGHPRDTVFVIMSRAECAAMHEALKELRSVFRRWQATARNHKVTNYSRSVDIELPPVSFAWRSIMTADSGREYMDYHDRRCAATEFPKPVFVVGSDGDCAVEIVTDLLDPVCGGEPYHVRVLLLSPAFVTPLIEMTDVRRADRKLAKMSGRSGDCDSLFE